MISEAVKERLSRYVSSGIPPGGFLLAVLSNDLVQACGQADDENRAALFDIVRYVYNCIPAACWGDKQTVAEWINHDGKEGA